MTHLVRSIWAFFRVDFATMLQYRAEILLWATWGLVNPAVLYTAWSSAAQGAVDQRIAGMNRGEIAAYYFAIMIIGHVTAAWDAYEMGYHVRTGGMSAKLLRPILPIWEALSGNLAYKVATLMFVAPAWVIFAWFVQPKFHTLPWQFGLGIVAMVLASFLNFMFGYVIALAAFWSPKLDAIGEIYFGLGMFLGGRIAPIGALPGPVKWLALHLPFHWMFAFPADLTIGLVPDMREAAAGVAVQAAWLMVFAVGFRFAWAAAVKRYTAVSG